jgi:ParB family transcriptional regulator, chromosome partitioning protein
LTHTRLQMTWPGRSRARTRTNSAPAEEILLSAIDGIHNDKLTGFALRLALTGHVAIPREGEVDFLAEAETAIAPPQPKNAVSKKPKGKTPMPIKAASKPAPKKTTAKKKATS